MSNKFAHSLERFIQVATKLDLKEIEKLTTALRNLQGRLFIIGVGGSAANASHAVNDFRKICNIEAYAPTDNVAELTAITNDIGWEYVFVNWLKTSKLNNKDMILVFSVGGGTETASRNITLAVEYAKEMSAIIAGIVGPDGGATKQHADICINVPADGVDKTPFTEAMQVLIWHLIAMEFSIDVKVAESQI